MNPAAPTSLAEAVALVLSVELQSLTEARVQMDLAHGHRVRAGRFFVVLTLATSLSAGLGAALVLMGMRAALVLVVGGVVLAGAMIDTFRRASQHYQRALRGANDAVKATAARMEVLEAQVPHSTLRAWGLGPQIEALHIAAAEVRASILRDL